ncbi:hypothetical protein B0H16DRAFT_1545910 [Mycena metata]|uniref:Uncharacterized protein n=1 Tax=Mycena metata TaxID=1033252 RepID=A0AAD7J1P8_9AGAR|nr:hypothetical protein B0H16DRAFT_1545910 [Mycena metata]
MPASSPKDRFHAIFIHRVPPHLSSKEFENKVEAWMDEYVQLAAVKKNIVKAEMWFQEKSLDEHVGLLRFAPPAPAVIVNMVQTETLDHMREMLMDRELIRLCDRGKEFHFQDGASALSVDIMAKTDFVVPQNTARIMAIFKAPRHVTLEDYSVKFHRCWDECFSLPEVKKNRVKYDAWEQNNAISDCLPRLGHTAPEPMIIGTAECESLDNIVDDWKEPQLQQLVHKAIDDPTFNLAAEMFAFKVVTKLDRA